VAASEYTWIGSHPSPNWRYYGWPGGGILPELPCGISTGMWFQKVECFVRYLAANPMSAQVVMWMPSYLEVMPGTDIASLTKGYLVPQATRYDITEIEALQAQYPALIVVHATSSLARSIGSAEATAFNDQLRAYVAAHGGWLLDIADIEAHDPSGNPCSDNRDGVPYILNGTLRENYPDDGLDLPAICPHYTSETNGGHLGSPSAGMIRLSKAVHVLMAKIAGWVPE
jgi:hypothetical protein